MKKTSFLRNVVTVCLVVSATMCFAQTELKPHFTEASKKIPFKKDPMAFTVTIYPEIHEGMISIQNGQQMFVNAETGKYVYGTNFNFTTAHRDYPYFSGGAFMATRLNPGDYAMTKTIIYPDGKYRDLPPMKDNAGRTLKLSNITVSGFDDGYALVQKGVIGIMTGIQQVFIDKNGKEVFPALVSTQKTMGGDLTVYPLRENRRVFYDAGLEKYGYADEKGNIIVKPQFKRALNFSEGLAAVAFGEDVTGWGHFEYKWGFIDLTGKMVIEATYAEQPSSFSDGLAAVHTDIGMSYIDKTGKLMMDAKTWRLNQFHNGFAWVISGYNKLFVIDKEFKEVRDLSKEFDVSNFSMERGENNCKVWGFDFPNGMQELQGKICAPDGTILYTAVDAAGNKIQLQHTIGSDLFFCKLPAKDAPQNAYLENDAVPCFINTKGEVVFYFENATQGFEGVKPVRVQ